MKFGLSLPNFGDYFHPNTLAELAVLAEDVGWDGFFIWDHMFFGLMPVADPWISLAAIAVKTNRIRLGPMVTAIPRRRPTKLARETVTLDHLSNGRLIFGVGIGVGQWEWEWHGEEADLKKRGDMLDEGLEVLTQLWSGEPYSIQGDYYRLRGYAGDSEKDAIFLPRTFQQPRIPIWAGGMWPNKRPFRRAAKLDGVMPIRADAELDGSIYPEVIREVVSFIQAQRGTLDEYDVIAYGASPGDDPVKARGMMEEFTQAGATWWIEAIDPWHFGWNWEGDWPLEQMNERIEQGPPSL